VDGYVLRTVARVKKPKQLTIPSSRYLAPLVREMENYQNLIKQCRWEVAENPDVNIKQKVTEARYLASI